MVSGNAARRAWRGTSFGGGSLVRGGMARRGPVVVGRAVSYRTDAFRPAPRHRQPLRLLRRGVLGLRLRHESVDQREIPERLDLPRQTLDASAGTFDTRFPRIGIPNDIPDRAGEVAGVSRLVRPDIVGKGGDDHRQP